MNIAQLIMSTIHWFPNTSAESSQEHSYKGLTCWWPRCFSSPDNKDLKYERAEIATELSFTWCLESVHLPIHNWSLEKCRELRRANLSVRLTPCGETGKLQLPTSFRSLPPSFLQVRQRGRLAKVRVPSPLLTVFWDPQEQKRAVAEWGQAYWPQQLTRCVYVCLWCTQISIHIL